MGRISTTFRNLLQLRDAKRELERLRRAPAGEAESGPPNGNGDHAFIPFFRLTGEDGNVRRMEDIEAETIRFALHYYHGHMTEVARRSWHRALDAVPQTQRVQYPAGKSRLNFFLLFYAPLTVRKEVPCINTS